MTCPTCDAWAAMSPKQLNIRLRNMAANPQAGVHRCPMCDGTDWATVMSSKAVLRPGSATPLPLFSPFGAVLAVVVIFVSAMIIFLLEVTP